MYAASLLVAAAGLGLAGAAEIRHRDGIHRVEKAESVVTAAPELHKRARTVCPSSYELCPESLQGGCCAEGFACATDSCFATTRGPQTCDGHVGYYACDPEEGGGVGCCPEGTVCRRGSKCEPMSGVSYSHGCDVSSYLCPSELGYGCCRNGMGCGENRCYHTDPSTYVFTQTTTTTTADEKQTITTTITTVSTPTAPVETADAAEDPDLNKFYPSFVPKVEPLITDDNGGLTKPQIGGIVGGAVGLLAIFLVVAFFIVRHLNRVVKAVEGARDSSQGSSSHPQMSQFNKPAESEADVMAADPLMSPRGRHQRGGSESESGGTPLGWQSPDIGSGNQGTPSTNNGYHAVPTSGSLDSMNHGGYFDAFPPRPQRTSSQSMPGQVRSSIDSQGMYSHSGRLRSNTAETTSDILSSGQQTPLELDSKTYVELPASSPTDSPLWRSGTGVTGSVSRPPLTHQRSRSGGSGSGSGGHGRSDSAAGMGTPQLDVVAEHAETHGHYGPPDKIVGQTLADYSK